MEKTSGHKMYYVKHIALKLFTDYVSYLIKVGGLYIHLLSKFFMNSLEYKKSLLDDQFLTEEI